MEQQSVFILRKSEMEACQLAYFGEVILMALLYFGTQEGKEELATNPALIQVAIANASYEYTHGIPAMYSALLQKASTDDFWEDDAHGSMVKEMLKINAPDEIRYIMAWLCGDYSILHPQRIFGGLRLEAWIERCSFDMNLTGRLHKSNSEYIKTFVLKRIGNVYVDWCMLIGEILQRYIKDDVSRIKANYP